MQRLLLVALGVTPLSLSAWSRRSQVLVTSHCRLQPESAGGA
jgi:hypothetical protein